MYKLTKFDHIIFPHTVMYKNVIHPSKIIYCAKKKTSSAHNYFIGVHLHNLACMEKAGSMSFIYELECVCHYQSNIMLFRYIAKIKDFEA